VGKYRSNAVGSVGARRKLIDNDVYMYDIKFTVRCRTFERYTQKARHIIKPGNLTIHLLRS